MHSTYLYCAIFGSALVVINFVTLLLGVGGDHDGGGGDSFDGDASGADAGGDAGDTGSADGDANGDSGDSGDASGRHGGVEPHMDFGSTFLRMFTIRTVTAGIAFFGLGGLACADSALSSGAVLAIAIVSGAIGMYVVYRMCRWLSAFNHNGALTLDAAVGSTGTVYLRVPGARAGIGKVTVVQQEREVEYEAVTDDPTELTAGTPIKIVEILSSNHVLVARVQ